MLVNFPKVLLLLIPNLIPLIKSGDHILYDSSPFQLIEACLMASQMLYPGECLRVSLRKMYAWLLLGAE